MEERMKKYRQVSPDLAKVLIEKSPKYHYNHHYNNHQQQQQQNNKKVPVVYYLCRNRQLEHPHFMEVSLSFPDGLHLRDVIERLNVLRGRGMASMYSWSCKRSYKNGFVWHDLCNDDLILPAHGNEYVLKGSELFEDSNSGNFSPPETVPIKNPKAIPEPRSSRSHDESSSSSIGRNAKTTSHDDESSPSDQRPFSPDFPVTKTCESLSDASTQTDENTPKTLGRTQNTRNRGVSTEDGLIEPPSTSTAPSSLGRTDTLESLIRTDPNKLNSFRNHEIGEYREMPCQSKIKASTMIMQLISCGSISVKDGGFGIIPTYKPRFTHSKFPSPLFSGSIVSGENPRLMGTKLEDKEYFSGSFVETIKEGVPNLKRSSSFNADKSRGKFDFTGDEEEKNLTRGKCIPRSIKASLSKNPKCESMRSSPLSEGPRISSDRPEISRTTTPGASNGGSKRMTDPIKQSSNHGAENVIRIEESLLQELGL